MRESTGESRQDDAEDKFVNYMPGMPKLSNEPGRIERFLTRLFRRRGPLRATLRGRDE
ncbi:hypothetical protein [Halorubrum sp. BOL3-1]|uniref:hypothetical protein n=1 Tax=Halorubrum sp. BOL3-1 TaxID=2497325 RepID=UPI00140C4227|nr:hypothetical protein [Halorubrum sp. BOL3-1]